MLIMQLTYTYDNIDKIPKWINYLGEQSPLYKLFESDTEFLNNTHSIRDYLSKNNLMPIVHTIYLKSNPNATYIAVYTRKIKSFETPISTFGTDVSNENTKYRKTKSQKSKPKRKPVKKCKCK